MRDPVAAIVAAESSALGQPLPPEALCADVQRVALFTEAFLPKVDGVSRTALLTIRHLQRSGRKLLVFAPHPAPSDIEGTPIYSVPSLWLPSYPETRVALLWLPILWRLQRFQPDLIHLFSPFTLGFMGMVSGGALGVPVVANYQTDLPGYAESYGAPHFAPLFRAILRYIHNGCTLTLAPTPIVLAQLRTWRFKRLRLWGRGVDTARFTPERRSAAWQARLRNGRDRALGVALYVGRMAREKHLEALRDIASDPSVALTLIGNGNYLPQVKQTLCSNGRSAHFIGHLLGDDLADAYAAADVFVFPAVRETFGQVILEAMASGLPVVAADQGGSAALVQHGKTGFLVPAHDSAAFHERTCQLLTDAALRRRMSAAARAYAEQHAWSAVMRDLEGYYAEATRLQRRRARMRRC
ncbi:MAG: glycosyltransferase family 1 protein [Anaerolineae bacterium]|nr:glycosyltransferase family 1 protein [Anaerolineae bacterium]MDW8300564.1 glycosyltransferase family 1 protein [Anaerolineae bacterium]